MKKKDLIAATIIGVSCGIIFILVSRVLELPDIVLKVSRFSPIILPLLSILGIYFVSIASEKFPTIFQMAKSFLVGILNTFIDLGILNLLMWVFTFVAGWQYTVFKGISFTTSIINSYFWSKFWVFEEKEKPKTKQFGKFYTVALVGLLIHLITASFVVNIIGPQFGLDTKLWANIGGIAAAFAGFLWNFFGYKLLVFKK